jgi:DNA-binding beta-propeller fold protein YncE
VGGLTASTFLCRLDWGARRLVRSTYHETAENYVSDWTNGAVAVVDPSAVKVLRTARLPLGDADNRTFAAAAFTGLLYLAGNDAIAAVDTASMRVVDRWRMDGEVAGLEVSPDGRTVYVAVAGTIAMMDAATGRQIGAVPVGGVNDILHAS